MFGKKKLFIIIWMLLYPFFVSYSVLIHLLNAPWMVISCLIMNSTRSWNILVWNVRGSNAKEKWDCIRDKISECSA